MDNGLQWVSGDKTPTKVYITRVFNLGTWDEWVTMKKDCSEQEIKEAVFHPLKGQWNKRAKYFAECFLNCQMPKEALISYEW